MYRLDAAYGVSYIARGLVLIDLAILRWQYVSKGGSHRSRSFAKTTKLPYRSCPKFVGAFIIPSVRKYVGLALVNKYFIRAIK